MLEVICTSYRGILVSLYSNSIDSDSQVSVTQVVLISAHTDEDD